MIRFTQDEALAWLATEIEIYEKSSPEFAEKLKQVHARLSEASLMKDRVLQFNQVLVKRLQGSHRRSQMHQRNISRLDEMLTEAGK